MGRNINDLIAELSAKDRAEVDAQAELFVMQMREASALDEIRKAAKQTQEQIASKMGIGQNAVSQLEKRPDLHVSTLGKYVESLGFELELSVVTASGERVALENYHPWKSALPSRSARGSKKKAAAPKKATPKESVAASKGHGSRRG